MARFRAVQEKVHDGSILERSARQGGVASGAQVSFDLNLSLRNAAEARALSTAVSTPGSAQYRPFMTTAQWVARFAPTQPAVASAESWLRQQGFKVGSVPSDRLFIPASGSASQVERAFGTSLSIYKVKGQNVRLADSTLSVPTTIAGVVAGVVGVNQEIATNYLSNGANAGATDCFDSSLLAAENTAITSGANVVSNSWGNTLGDLLEDAAAKQDLR